MFEVRDLDIIQESTDPFTISFIPSDANLNVNGVIHGGILSLLSDEVVGRYVTSKGRKGAAADMNMHFYRPAVAEKKILATISERKVGKRLGTYLVELKDEKGTLIADAIFTVLMGDEVEPRREYIQSHAHEVENLYI